MKQFFENFWSFVLISFLLAACQKNESIGLDIIDDDVSIFTTDTATLIVSTVILDSIVSSGTGRALIGGFSDNLIGTITSKAYFQLSLGTEWETETGAEFDSLVLYMTYNYYYGDTTQTQKLRLRKLRGKIELPDNQTVFYSNNNLPVLNETFATLNFQPRPNANRPLKMRLPDELGENLLQMAKNQSDTLTDEDTFESYLRGFLMDIDGESKCLLGFQTALDTANNMGIFMRLFYHKGLDKYQKDFSLSKADLQFNQISNNRSGTYLADLQTQKVDLNSQNTNNQAYNVGGLGMMIKVKIPYLNSALNLGGLSRVMYAELICKPVKGTYGNTLPLPQVLELYATDKLNRFISTIANSSGEAVQANLVWDKEFDQNTYYKFDLTNYILTELSQNVQKDNSLLITLPLSDLQSSFNRVILGNAVNREYKMQLRVIYTKFL